MAYGYNQEDMWIGPPGLSLPGLSPELWGPVHLPMGSATEQLTVQSLEEYVVLQGGNSLEEKGCG